MTTPRQSPITEAGVERTAYVCGFLFAEVLGGYRVLLIQKARPSWQAGKLNGIGGHIEPGEQPLEAMNREFHEEAGLQSLHWKADAVLTGRDFQVHFFSAWAPAEIFDTAAAKTDEPLVRVHVEDLGRRPLIPNLQVLIPLALDSSGICKPVQLYDGIPESAQIPARAALPAAPDAGGEG